MGTLWRSERMQLLQLFLATESAHEALAELGEAGLCEFRDLNRHVMPQHKAFISDVKRCDAAQQTLNFIANVIAADRERRALAAKARRKSGGTGGDAGAGAGGEFGFDESDSGGDDDDTDADVVSLEESVSGGGSGSDSDAAEMQHGAAVGKMGSVARPMKEFQMDDLEETLADVHRDLVGMNKNLEDLTRNFNELVELKHVLQKDAAFFYGEAAPGGDVPMDEYSDSGGSSSSDSDSNSDDSSSSSGGDAARRQKQKRRSNRRESRDASAIKLGFVTGTMRRAKFMSFESLLWRATRGNLFMRHAEIEDLLTDPASGMLVEKNAFIIFFQGDQAEARIKKICDSYAANLYPCPETSSERGELLDDVEGRLADLATVLQTTVSHRKTTFRRLGRQMPAWKEFLLKELAIFHHLNMFNYESGRKVLIGEAWCPTAAIERVEAALERANAATGATTPSFSRITTSREEPPSHFVTNKFTKSFQGLVAAYGIARYGEVNPAVFTIMTFPFLFGVMFGDLGHGFMLLLFAAYMCWKEDQLQGNIPKDFKTIFNGRYMILLMAVFAMYAGALYNDVFAWPMDFGYSQWEFPKPCCKPSWNTTDGWPDWCYGLRGEEGNYTCDGPEERAGTMVNGSNTYPFGVDPGWRGAENTLAYYNSLKMKMSVILGVGQMTAGIILSAFNAVHYRSAVDIYAGFVPQLIFLLSLFGYMDFLIFYKWLAPIDEGEKPMIINVMIDMFLNPFELPAENDMFDGQHGVQVFLLIMALIAVPWMLCVKPFVLRSQHKKELDRQAAALVGNAASDASPTSSEQESSSSDSESSSSSDSTSGPHKGKKPKIASKSKKKRRSSSEDSSASPTKVAVSWDDESAQEEFDFGEIFVHQIIHTIEFVLGAVSNTASYLRLWALSLAHAQLSEVFWDRIFLFSIEIDEQAGGIGIVAFAGFAVWAAATVAVLLCMESLSAFLHALRLHWVEFQNKFYYGDGRKFEPFDFQALINAAENPDDD